jgi:predicted DNA binding CopG/RHH family protein
MKKQAYLDDAEKQIIESLEVDGWQSVDSQTKDGFVTAARKTLTKDQRINIRLSSRDIDGIRMKAADEGIPYQTLIASILHKYVTGRLVDAK